MNASKPPLSAPQVARVFRALAEEHIETRRADDPERLWPRLARRSQSRLRLVPPRPRPRFKPVWLALAAGLLVWLVSLLLPSERIGYEVSGASTSGELIATEEKPASVLFSERSRIELGAHTTLRVQIEENARILVRLSQGELDVHVVHGPKTDFRFMAGPYEVKVVGTSFRLHFDPERARLQVALSEGRVHVYDAARRLVPVQAGQSISLENGAFVVPEDPTAAPAAETSLALGSTAASDLDPQRKKAEAPGREPAVTQVRNLAARGEFSEIIRLAEERGLSRVLAEWPSSALHELAQAALYTKNTSLADKAWRRLRARFPGERAGVNAAFFLGRLSDQSGRNGEALEFFDAYLREAPRGVYAAEALGRKLLLVKGTQGNAGAVGLAREYLARFPNGAYATNARQLLEEH